MVLPSRSRSRASIAWFIACSIVIAFGAVTACGTSPDKLATPLPPPSAPSIAATPAGPTLSPPFDVASVAERLRRAYRAEGDAWVSRGATYAVRASAGGVSLTPHDSGRDAAPAVFSAAQIARGPSSLATSGVPRVNESGALAIDRGACVETLTNGESGFEQSWAFAARPRGAGDLVVRLGVSGVSLVASTASGLHFASAPGAAGVRYGHGTWVDASGARIAVPARFVDGAIELRVAAGTLERSAWPAVLDPNVGVEHGIDNPVTGVPTDRQNYFPQVLFDGTQYFVSWIENRSGPFEVFGTRISVAGAILDPVGIPIQALQGDSITPISIAHLGAQYLVVWSDAPPGSNGIDVYGSFVPTAGGAASARFTISSALKDQVAPVVATDGSEFFVAWDDTRNGGHDIYGTRISAGGTVLNSSGIAIDEAFGDQTTPSIAYGAGGFLVTWTDGRDLNDAGVGDTDVYARLVQSNGSVGAELPLVTGVAGATSQSVAAGAGEYLFTWLEGTAALTVHASRVSAAGAVLDGSSAALGQTEIVPGGAAGGATATFDGTAFAVAWNDTTSTDGGSNGTTTVAQLDATTGAKIGATVTFPLLSTNYYGAPGVAASSATSYLVAWQKSHAISAGFFLEGTIWKPGTAPGATFPINIADNTERTPSVAFDGTNYLVAWSDSRNIATTGYSIYAARVSPTGTMLDPSGIAVDVTKGNGLVPAVAFDGTNYLVAWSKFSSDVVGQLVSKSGTLVGGRSDLVDSTSSFNIGTQCFALVFDGTNYLVVWGEYVTGQIQAEHATTALVPVEATPLVVATTATAIGSGNTVGSSADIAVAFDGTNALVVWGDTRPSFDPGLITSVYGARVPKSGATLDSGGFAIATGGGTAKYNPVVAFDGTAYTVAFLDATQYSNGGALEYARVSTAGAVVSTSPTVIASGNVAGAGNGRSAAVFDGTNTLLTWTDVRTGSAQIYGARVSTAGALLDSGGFVIAGDPVNAQTSPAIGANPTGKTALVAYVRNVPSAGTARLESRFVSEVSGEGVGAGCTTNADCANNQCVDGFCCDSACNATDPTRCTVCSAARGSSSDGHCGDAPATLVCRAPGDECQIAAKCTGSSPTCPADGQLGNGVPCSFGVCENGLCTVVDAGPGDAGSDASDAGQASDASQPSDGGQAGDAGDAGQGSDASDAGHAADASDASQASDANQAGDANGAQDANAATDASPTADASEPGDATTPGTDSGTPIVVLDGSPEPEAGEPVATPAGSSGCGCRTAPSRGGSSAAWMAMLGLLGIAARRSGSARRGRRP